MGFEELTRKITDIKDKEMAMEFTQTIGKLLKENGVTVHCSECEQSTMTGGLLEIVFDQLDFTEHDKKFIDEIECWKKKCSDLSNYNKQLKYDLEKCENKKNENKELPFDPLEVVDMLINETYQCSIPFTGRKTKSRKYGIDELEQIAEHLFVYCKHNNIEE